MIIIGDYAYPHENLKIPDSLKQEEFILINCEGYLTHNITGSGVFNNIKSLEAFDKKKLILGLANNHVMDIPDGVINSLALARINNILTVGAGKNIDQALEPLIVTEDGIEIAIIAAGWDVIGCKHATKTTQGVAPLKEKLIIPIIENQKKLGRKVLIYVHWGYELEIYPHPTHRNMAKTLIDVGADIILGGHAHCIQGYEKYNEKFIFYGLGNAIFQEKYYYDGRLKFPDFCTPGLALRWSPDQNTIAIANINLSENLVHMETFGQPEKNLRLIELSSFQKLNSQNYVNFFSANRRKRNILPIFQEHDSSITYKIKNIFLKVRAKIISILFRLNFKSSSQ